MKYVIPFNLHEGLLKPRDLKDRDIKRKDAFERTHPTLKFMVTADGEELFNRINKSTKLDSAINTTALDNGDMFNVVDDYIVMLNFSVTKKIKVGVDKKLYRAAYQCNNDGTFDFGIGIKYTLHGIHKQNVSFEETIHTINGFVKDTLYEYFI